MIQNVYENGPNEASNTNTKLPDLKWWKLAENDQNMCKMTVKQPKMAQIMAIFCFHSESHITF